MQPFRLQAGAQPPSPRPPMSVVQRTYAVRTKPSMACSSDWLLAELMPHA